MKEPVLGDKIGRYRLTRKLGQGGVGVVYHAQDPFIDREVAIKTALAPQTETEETKEAFRDLFFNEARAAGRLAHPNIVSLFDAMYEDDRGFLVMEYVDGHTLKEYCGEDRRMSIDQVVKVIFLCAKALYYAHEHGVVHSDIKPANIMITKEWEVKIADFGIAKVKGASEVSEGGPSAASLYYASPEQLTGKPLTPQTDIFSLGVVMYELLTGVRPFAADSEVAILYKTTQEDPEPISDYRNDVPDLLQRIVFKALAKNPSDRYQTALQFASELSAAFDHLHTVEEEVTFYERVNMLKKVSFFNEFGASELVEVLKATKWVKHKPGAVIIREGAIEDSFYVILSGEVDVIKNDTSLAVLKKGDCFGEMAYLGRTARTATIMARIETILMKINATVIDQTSLTTQNSFHKAFNRTLIQRVIMTNEMLARGA